MLLQLGKNLFIFKLLLLSLRNKRKDFTKYINFLVLFERLITFKMQNRFHKFISCNVKHAHLK